MKAYLVTTGILFGLMAVVHGWRAIVEWPHPADPEFVLGMFALIAVPGVLSWWAWQCLRNLSGDGTRREDKESRNKDSGDSAA